MKKLSKKSQQLNDYMVANPDAKAMAIAKKFKVSVANIYQRKSKLKSAAPKATNWKTVMVSTSDKSIVARYAQTVDMVNHPPHYKVGGIETIDFIEAKQLDFCLGNAIKYITRAGLKGDKKQDLQKAQFYLNRAVSKL